ncbi:MAG: hypothetical protein Q8L27_04190 [archaeon]|nr:hypothetical protein [archaeon]
MNNKKGQGELITTVLIILVVLDAVAGVAYFVTNTIKTKTTAGDQQAQCLEALIQMEQVKSADTSVIVRNIGTKEIKTVSVYKSGNSVALGTGADLGVGLSSPITVGALTEGDNLEVTAIITSTQGGDINCGLKASATVIA